MITDTCPACGASFSYDDPRQMHSMWNEVLGMWEPICGDCADLEEDAGHYCRACEVSV